MKKWLAGTAMAFGLLECATGAADAAVRIEGQVRIGGGAVAGSTVTLWAASVGAPMRLAQVQTDADGQFAVSADQTPSGASSLYLVASGGTSAADKAGGDRQGVDLLAVLGDNPPAEVVVNELTTVASAFTNARFINGESISGNPLGLKIAAGNVPNLVDPATGGWGKVLLDPLNSTQTTTLATLDTLGSLITAYVHGRQRRLARPLPQGRNPDRRRDAQEHARSDGRTSPASRGLTRRTCTRSSTKPIRSRRTARGARRRSCRTSPSPRRLRPLLAFAGGGTYSPGRFMFDADGNLWSGQNWMPGSQSGVINSIGGGVLKMTPQRNAALAADHRLHRHGHRRRRLGHRRHQRQGLDHQLQRQDPGDGFRRQTGRQGERLPLQGETPRPDGHRRRRERRCLDRRRLGQSVAVLPRRQLKDGQIVKVAGLKSPFDIVIDAQNRVWVSNSQSDTVVRFPADDPSKVETFHAGISVRALALDSKGNVWVASNMSLDFPVPEDSRRRFDHGAVPDPWRPMCYSSTPKSTGVVSMIRPDGISAVAGGFTGGGAVDIPWGLNIDGNDDVWIGNFWAANNGVVLMAGDNTKGHPAGTKTGDVIHVFRAASIQMLTDRGD